ncbi:hypothetical protein NX059_012399 [Plenodomus lindquistii]|nr:hypothetical protein NX059_012399 [Plenodomus lindquistii]
MDKSDNQCANTRVAAGNNSEFNKKLNKLARDTWARNVFSWALRLRNDIDATHPLHAIILTQKLNRIIRKESRRPSSPTESGSEPASERTTVTMMESRDKEGV